MTFEQADLGAKNTSTSPSYDTCGSLTTGRRCQPKEYNILSLLIDVTD